MAGRVLGDRLHPGGEQPRRHRASQSGDGKRLLGERPIADHRVSAGNGKIQHRRGSHVEAGRNAVESDQRAGQPRRPHGAQRGGRRMRAPVRRTQSRDAAAFLIDHQHRATRQDAAQVGGQRRKLRRRLDVAGEQDDAARLLGAEQRGLVG